MYSGHPRSPTPPEKGGKYENGRVALLKMNPFILKKRAFSVYALTLMPIHFLFYFCVVALGDDAEYIYHSQVAC